ncbi:MAG: hypothetical protein MI862_26775 [Desulfobacterales bacterium]|nr:hypothetical protein [Desulfobacterales bacterium]
MINLDRSVSVISVIIGIVGTLAVLYFGFEQLKINRAQIIIAEKQNQILENQENFLRLQSPPMLKITRNPLSLNSKIQNYIVKGISGVSQIHEVSAIWTGDFIFYNDCSEYKDVKNIL